MPQAAADSSEGLAKQLERPDEAAGAARFGARSDPERLSGHSGVDSVSSMRAWAKVIAVALGLLGLTLAWRFRPLAQIVAPENVTEWACGVGALWWAPLIVIAAYTPACLVMFPRPLITLAAVVAFGPWLGFLYAMSGILVAALATYFAGRHSQRDTVRRLAGKRLNRLSAVLRQRGLLAMTVLRLVPVAPFAVEGVVAGAIRVKLWHYTVGTFLGMLPGALAATVFGDQITAALEDSTRINWWIVSGIVATLALGMLAIRKWLGRLS